MKWAGIVSSVVLAASSRLVAGAPAADSEYEYIVVGSGAGGGPLACRLARAGHKTLLIEAGNSQDGNVNITVPGYQAAVTQDPKLRWDFFVNHYEDQERAKRDPKYTYEVGPNQYHVGPNPPANAKELGILYPRAGVLGGCVSHNALIWITPHASDWNNIATLTGDDSWKASKMDGYQDKLAQWLPTQATDVTILLKDLKLAQHLIAGASLRGIGPAPIDALTALGKALLVSPNNRLDPKRDSAEGFYTIPLIQKNGARTAVREFIQSTVKAGYPLTVKQNRFVTKVTFDKSGDKPRATGVDYLDGEYLYRASPLSGGKGTPGSVTASKEVILAAGAFNTPQLLKLSGIGPKDELAKFDIPLIKDSPGVGTNLQDRYEIPVNVKHGKDFPILDGCTFDSKPSDKCLQQWKNNPYILALRGAYATNGLAAALATRSSAVDAYNNIDLFTFGGPINFQGYFPQYADDAVADHKHFSWYTLKAHTRNRAGTVALRSADPLDPPQIDFHYFDEGTTEGGADQKDLAAMVEAIRLSRKALGEYKKYSILGGDSFVEEEPGPEVTSDEDLGQYVKDRAWGHHASCSVPIGAADDDKTPLDGQFRVKGVDGLRVVDASVFPEIPGIFIQAPIIMMSEKAADTILKG